LEGLKHQVSQNKEWASKLKNMLELPDVEILKLYFRATSLGQKIKDIDHLNDSNPIQGLSFLGFREKLLEKEFEKVDRRGNFLLVSVKQLAETLVIRFGKEGGLHYTKQDAPLTEEDELTRLRFKFQNDYELRWLDPKNLGEIYFGKDFNKASILKNLGPEPLSFSEEGFRELLGENELLNVKTFFLTQEKIAGIGNIYADEILYQAKINPHRQIGNLQPRERKELHRKMLSVLEESLVFIPKKNFDSSWLIAHRHADMRCPSDKEHQLDREIIAGQATVFCPICQN
jgi:formamidopyrimidine-DNA glycosylase